MRGQWLALSLGAALALAACGKQESAEQRSPAGAPPAAAQTAVEQPKTQGPTSGLQAKIAHLNEDGSETVPEAASDNGAHNAMLAAVASTIAASTPTASAATTNGPTLWQEGVNYTRLVPAQPTDVPAGQVEVLEFFWYACPHCYAIDPLVESWRKTKPAYVSFSRVPVMWNEGHRSLARLYYTLESMGKLDQLHSEVFKEIHASGKSLVAANPNDTAESERIQTAFITRFGISEDAFKKAYHSFAVETALQRADQLGQRYRIDGVPTFIVNGKYVADVRSAEGPEHLLSLVGDLAAQEHKP
jgi:thiol:disulfide interchange protein DsbA